MSFQLCIGSAQFGLNYGVTNKRGKINDDEIKEILFKAYKANINFIDTAQNYGSSEEVIGKCKPLESNFKIISKLSSYQFDCKIPKSEIFQTWDNSLISTLKNLRINNLDSFLVHNAGDFSNFYKDYLLEWLKSLKDRSIVRRLGVSIYSDEDLVNIPLEEIDIIQLPFSIYDQRLLKNGSFKKFYEFNISIHLRSIFLQGLILTPIENWPSFINKDFRNHHQRLCQYLSDENVQVLDFVFWYLSEKISAEAVVVGVSSLEEFEKVLKSYQEVVIEKKYSKFENKFKNLDWNIDSDLDPRQWNK